jgi:hypothetical protein
VLYAAGAFLEAVADVLRQLLQVGSWLVLLIGTVELLISLHETLRGSLCRWRHWLSCKG